MIAVLDPAFFVARQSSPNGVASLRADLRALLSFLRTTGAELVAADDYWRPLWQELIRPLERLNPSLRIEFSELRKRAVATPLATVSEQHRVWGFRPMFDVPQGQWRRLMGSNPSYFTACGDSCRKLGESGGEDGGVRWRTECVADGGSPRSVVVGGTQRIDQVTGF